MGAAVPFAGATMTGFGGAAATAAATSAATMAASSFVPTLLTASTGIPVSGGLLGSITSAYQAIKPYTGLLSAGTSVLQGIGALAQGSMLQSQYDLQAQQIQAQNEINKLNYINDATEKARRLMAVNASALAAGYAGGVNGLDGSVKLIMQENEKEYIKDIQMAEFNQMGNDNFANAESSLLRAAGDSAAFGSKVEALTYIGSAAKLFEESRIPT